MDAAHTHCDHCHAALEQRGESWYCPACLLREMMGEDDVLPPQEIGEAMTIITPSAVPQTGLPLLPRHRLLEKIGEGGFANVYRALQREPVRRETAVKVLKPQVISASVLARFEMERQTLARMEHPGIARLWDSGVTEEGAPFFAMELVRGEPVTSFCERHKLGLDARLELFRQICDAVQHAHEKGVLHRDLKPSNILVAPSGDGWSVKVIDFGIAKVLETAAGEEDSGVHTAIHQTVGTPGYMSPEQALGGSQDVDVRSDLYALGVVLYELVTMQTPLQVERRADPLGRRHSVAEHVTPPSALPGTLLLTRTEKRDLDAITRKALEQLSSLRYASAAAFSEDVQRHLRDEPVLAGELSWTYVTEKFTRRHLPLVAGVAVALFAVLAGLTVSLLLYLREQKARGRAEQAQLVISQRESELSRSLSRAFFDAAQHQKREGDSQSAIASLSRALRQEPSFHEAAADLQMMLAQQETPQPVGDLIRLDPEWGAVKENVGSVNAKGRVLAVLCEKGKKQRLMIFTRSDEEWTRHELPLQSAVSEIALSASGHTLVWSDVEQRVHGVSLRDGGLASAPVTWQAPAPVRSLALAMVNDLLCIGCEDGSVWRGHVSGISEMKKVGELGKAVTHLQVSPQQSQLFAGLRTGAVWRVDLAGENAPLQLMKLPSPISVFTVSLERSPLSAEGGSMPSLDGSYIVAAGDAAGHVAVCRAKDAQLLLEPLKLFDDHVTALALTRLNKQIIVAGGPSDLCVRWVDLSTKTDLLPALDSAGTVRRILTDGAGDLAEIICADSSVRLWRSSGGAARVLRRPQRARFISMSGPGRCMAVLRDSGTALEMLQHSPHIHAAITLCSYAPTARVESQDRSLESLCFTADGLHVLHSASRLEASLWKLSAPGEYVTASLKNAVLHLHQAPSGPMLAVQRDGSLSEMPLDDRPLVTRVPAEPKGDWKLAAISPDGRGVVWAEHSPDTQRSTRVRVWLQESGLLPELRAERLSAISIHAESKKIAFGLGNGHVRIVSNDGVRVQYQPLHQSRVTSMAFSPDGTLLLTGSTDGTAALWQVGQLNPLADAIPLAEPVQGVCFSADGRRFALCTSNQVAVGEVATRSLIGQPFRVRIAGTALALDAHGERVAVCVGAGGVLLLDVPPQPQSAAPEWFLDLAELYASRRLSANGTIDFMEQSGIRTMRGIIPKVAADSPAEHAWSDFASWLFTPAGLRQISPWSEITLEQYITRLEQYRPRTPRLRAELQRLNPLRYRKQELQEPERPSIP